MSSTVLRSLTSLVKHARASSTDRPSTPAQAGTDPASKDLWREGAPPGAGTSATDERASAAKTARVAAKRFAHPVAAQDETPADPLAQLRAQAGDLPPAVRHTQTERLKAELPEQFLSEVARLQADVRPAEPPAQLLAQAMDKLEAQWSEPKHPGGGDEAVARAKGLASLRARATVALRQFVGRKLYAPLRDRGRALAMHAGKIVRKYISGREPDEYNRRWMVVEELHKSGHFGGAFGHMVGESSVEPMSKVVATRDGSSHITTQKKLIGRDLVLPSGQTIHVKKAEIDLAMGVSGMSFPQLSAPSILALLYAQVRHAKDGTRYLLNTGEGGPRFRLALLEGNREALRSEIVAWGIHTGEFTPGSLEQAKVEATLDKLMKDRDALFADFSKEDIEQAQIVAQFGSAMNGIRGQDGRVDFGKLWEVGQNPHVAMVEYKLKQAAKRGSKVDPSKMKDPIAAAMREVKPGQAFQSPNVHPDFSSYEEIATLVLATKLVTHKPVSLKFAVGDVENMYEFLEYLAKMDALPDHIQIDGGGGFVSPGSGNAPPTGAGGNTSLRAHEAVMVVDGILEHLGVRDEVHLTMAGDVLLPTEALEAMALGADGVVGARTWMNMGLGCAKVGSCNSGSCPYGIASRSGSVFSASLDPTKIGPKAYEASKAWRETFTQQMAETGAMDWRVFRKTHGIHVRQDKLTVRHDGEQIPLKDAFGFSKAKGLLGGILDDQEIRQALYERRPPEQVAYERLDTGRRLLNFIDDNLDQTPEHAAQVDAFATQRLGELERFLETPRSSTELRDFIRDVPDELRMPGARQ